MNRGKIAVLFLFVVSALILSSCHPRHISDIKPNMTKQEVVALWGETSHITYKTADGKDYEVWEYHFLNTDSICTITFYQDRVINTQCQRILHPYYYGYPRYPYYPYSYPYPYYRYRYPYPYYYGPYYGP